MCVWQQVEIEERWIHQRVGRNEISKETAEKLGIKALAKKLNKIVLFHMEGFVKESKNKAVNLRQHCNQGIGQESVM